ncbi:MAG: tripartite tricarboxylate transporter substrate binding protein [Betaproteobacteria bacterium]|nr:tripartite tricarboxylate transporter substrate binding protein [Betaproteobacteria bacterium]
MRKIIRGTFRLFMGIAACMSFLVFDASSQNYPVKPIRIIVGFAPGGGADVIARMIAQKLSENLGQPVVVENRTGAGGSIANERVAKSPPDGYAMLLTTASATILPALDAKLPYDLERDLATVSLIAIGPLVLVVHPSVPARSVKQLIAIARSQPGKLNYGSSGVGGTGHLAGELFKLMSKVNIAHVPYKGGTESAIATAAGHVDMNFPSIPSALSLLEVRKIRPLAVTSEKRTSLMPSMPTISESGLLGYDRSGWYGMLVPAGVPKDIIARLNELIGKVVNTPGMKESFIKQGLESQTTTPEKFAAFIRGEIAQNAKVVKLAGLKAE